MPVSVTMPRLGESVTEGTITRWLKQEGDRVEADEPLLEVSTDKVDTEIPSPAAGVLTRIVVREDETAEVGSELAVISGEDESDRGGGQQAQRPTEPAQPAAQAQPGTEAQPAAAAQAQPATEAQRTADASPPPEQAQPAAEAPPVPAPSTPDGRGAGRAEPAQVRAESVEVPPADGGDRAQPATAGEGDASAQTAAVAAPESGAGGRPADSGPGGQGRTISVTMPALGESVTEGTVTRWLKSVGDEVAADEPLLEVSTDKVDTEIPSPAAGTLLEIKVPEDETVAVGAELAVIGAPGAAPAKPQPAAEPEPAAAAQHAPPEPEPAAAAQPAPPEPEPAPAAQQAPPEPEPAPAAQPAATEPEPTPEARPAAESRPAPQPAPQPAQAPPAAAAAGPAESEDGGGYVTPLVRKLAAEQNVDLSTLTGSGVGGRIRKQDVLDAAQRQRAKVATAGPSATAPVAAAPAAPAAKAKPSPLRGRTEKLSRLRQIIAKRMVESLQTAAQLTTVAEVDVTRIARLREQAKNDFAAMHGVKLSFLPFFALATVEALRVHPGLNAAIDVAAGTVTYHDAEHLGIAVDTERGLMVPVIRNAGDLNLPGIAKRIADLAERTRTMKIEPDELSGGTFTLTNTGSRGALFDTPIINQPQVAILGTGSVVKRAVVVDDPELGEIIVPRSMVYLALTYDHRLVDGADAARFLAAVKERLESGHFESELGLA